MKKVRKMLKKWKRRWNRTNNKSLAMFDEDEELGMFELVPDEICIEIFKFLPVEDLCQNIALVNKRFASLYRLGIHTVKIGGALRKLPEDSLIKVIRKFEKLEKLIICNNGQINDYQITNSGLIQLAHKYIYHTHDFFSCSQNEMDFMGFKFGTYEDMLETFSTTLSCRSNEEYSDYYFRKVSQRRYDIESDSDINTIQSIISFSSGPSEDLTEFSSRQTKKSSNDSNSSHSDKISSKSSGKTSGKVKPSGSRVDLRKRASLRLSVESFGSIVSQQLNRMGEKDRGGKKKKKKRDSLASDSSFSSIQKDDDFEVRLKKLREESRRREEEKKKLKKKEDDECEGEFSTDEEFGDDVMQIKPLRKKNKKKVEGDEEEDVGEEEMKKSEFGKQENKILFPLEAKKKVVEEPNYGLSTLKYLDLTGCNLLTDFGAKYLTYICQDVEHLCLRGCIHLTDKAIEYFESFRRIQSINLAGLNKLTDRSLSYLAKKPLRIVDLTFVRRLTDEGLSALAQCGETLEDINLQCCSQITSKGLDSLLAKCHKLTRLNLTGCNLIELCKLNTKEGSREVSKLKYLNLLGCTKLCDDCIRHLYGVMNCKELSSLSLAYSDFISGDGISLIVQNSRNQMKELILKKCPKISNESLLEVVKKMKKLEVLDLSQCDYNSSIFKKLKKIKIKKLVLVRSPCLNDANLRVLARIRSIRVLDLSNNDNISFEGLCRYCSSHYVPVNSRKSKKKYDDMNRKDNSKLKELILIRVPLNKTQKSQIIKLYPEIKFVFFREYINIITY